MMLYIGLYGHMSGLQCLARRRQLIRNKYQSSWKSIPDEGAEMLRKIRERVWVVHSLSSDGDLVLHGTVSRTRNFARGSRSPH